MALSYKDDTEADERLSPANRLKAAEEGSHDRIDGYDRSSDGLDARESEFNASDTASAAENRSENPNWKLDVGNKKIKVKGGRLKKFGPAGIIGGSLIGVLGTMMSFAPTTLLVNLKENFVNNFDQQSIISSNRSNKIIAKRLSGEATTGVCTSKVSLLCRYTRPSNYQISQFDRAGIKALDANGNVIEKRLWPNARPAAYDIPGVGKVSATDLNDVLRNNPQVRNAFKRAYNPRYVNWVDDVARKLFSSLGVAKAIDGALSAAANKKAAQAAVDGTLAVADKAAGNRALRTSLSELIERFAKKMATRSVKIGKQDAVLLSVAVGCIATKVPGLVSTAIKAYRLRALANVAFKFLTVADAIKAGEATPEEVENAGILLTDVVNGKSAMDGAIMYGIMGASNVGAAMTPVAQKYIPGKSAALWDTVSQYTDNKVTNSICNIAMNPYASAAITAFKLAKYAAVGAGTLGIGDVVLLVGDIASTAVFSLPGVESAIADTATSVASVALSVIPDGTLDSIFNLALGDMTEGVAGEDLSAVITNGADSSMSQAAGMGGSVALTPSQKIAYDNEITRPTQLAWAAEDRASHSPFDASNPNTFLGSIVTRLMPYYGSLSSISGVMSTFFSISSSSLANFLQPTSYAADTEETWQQCTQDISVATSPAATDPLCAVQYGIPAEFTNIDPETVVQDLYDSNNIDEDGDVISGSDLETWMSECNTGTSESASNCVIPNADDSSYIDRLRIAEFALYQIDKRVIDGMDNVDGTTDSSSTSAFYSSITDALAVY